MDSTYLLKIASEELGSEVLAVTVRSAAIPAIEWRQAEQFAAAIGARQVIIEADITKIPHFTDNPSDRCYYCKKAIFSEIGRQAEKRGIHIIADGTNVDDSGDHRPGLKALAELGIRSPLKECGFSKEDIRARSQRLQLKTWNLPSYACLASRFPYGTEITVELLHRVEQSENALRDLGFHQVRVRHHGDVARIEVYPEDIERLLEPVIRSKVVNALKRTGYLYVAVDLEGYRMGSLNAVFHNDSPQRW